MTHDVKDKAQAAKLAARSLARASAQEKNQALDWMALALESGKEEILRANAGDVRRAEPLVSSGRLERPALDRLILSEEKIRMMAAGVRSVASLPDPSGRLLARTLLDDGLELHKVTCPFGVLATIVESRPDAVVQIAALALKSGNALLIKAGAEAEETTECILRIVHSALHKGGFPEQAIAHVVGREAAQALLDLREYVDLVIPRGGYALVRYVQEHTRIPVLGHADGICHIYVDLAADPAMALGIILDAKVQSPGMCNAVETVLVHAEIADLFLPKLIAALRSKGVIVRGCSRTQAIAAGIPLVEDHEWRTEYGNLTLAIRVVSGLDEAIDHINRFGSGHTDAIITQDRGSAGRFMEEVDSAGVYHNVSTRFADGYRYGFGAEVGISTNKLHARGPVGLESLVTYKYKLFGEGQIVADYLPPAKRQFQHKAIAEGVEIAHSSERTAGAGAV